jgi:hypothetical protein
MKHARALLAALVLFYPAAVWAQGVSPAIALRFQLGQALQDEARAELLTQQDAATIKSMQGTLQWWRDCAAKPNCLSWVGARPAVKAHNQ